MADLAYRNEVHTTRVGRVGWGAIWAGMFTFVAIWSIFGLLGEAIFTGPGSANASQAASSLSVGMGIWSIILTIIAMYVAGRVTAHFSDVIDQSSRIMQGMAMFGLSVVAVIVTVIVGANVFSGNAAAATGVHNPYMLTMSSGACWLGFVCLLLGWLAAMGGAAHQGMIRGGTSKTSNVQDIRPAA